MSTIPKWLSSPQREQQHFLRLYPSFSQYALGHGFYLVRRELFMIRVDWQSPSSISLPHSVSGFCVRYSHWLLGATNWIVCHQMMWPESRILAGPRWALSPLGFFWVLARCSSGERESVPANCMYRRCGNMSRTVFPHICFLANSSGTPKPDSLKCGICWCCSGCPSPVLNRSLVLS